MELERPYEDDGLVFPDPCGKPLNPMALARAFQRYAKRLGLEGAKQHGLRHFHASVMLQNGQSLLLVSKRLSHACIVPTGDILGICYRAGRKKRPTLLPKLCVKDS